MIGAHERPATPEAVAFARQLSEHVPTLRTERLVLRALHLDDFPVLADLLASDRSQYVGGPVSRTEAWHEFTQLSSGWFLHGHGGWAIDFDGVLAGFVLVGVEPGDYEREIGFLITQDAEGKGIAFEAASAAKQYAFEVLRFPTLVSYIDPKNERSLRLAKRLGGTRDTNAESILNASMHVYRYSHAEAIA